MDKVKLSLTRSQQDYISRLEIITKKFFRFLLEQGRSFDEVKEYLGTLNVLELGLGRKIRQELYKKIEDKRFPGLAGEVYREFKGKPSEIKSWTTRCKKLLNSQKLSKRDEKWMRIFWNILSQYNRRIDLLNKEGFVVMKEGWKKAKEPTVAWGKVVSLQEDALRNEQLTEEDAEYALQSLKHIAKHRKNGSEFRVCALECALDPKVAIDGELYEKQAQCVAKTYEETTDPERSEKIKNICYDYIENVFKVTGLPHGVLVTFLLNGKWVSEKTFNLLKNVHSILQKSGMYVLVLSHVNNLLAKDDISMDTRQYLLELQKIYS